MKESLQDRVPWPDHHGYTHHGTRFNVKEKLLMSFLGLLRRREGRIEWVEEGYLKGLMVS